LTAVVAAATAVAVPAPNAAHYHPAVVAAHVLELNADDDAAAVSNAAAVVVAADLELVPATHDAAANEGVAVPA
jgi:hypothetical protein